MTHPADNPTPRREFLGQIAASAIVLAGAACASPASSAQTAAAPTPTPSRSNPPAPTHWDDSWVARLTAKHKAVFDSPDIEDGLAVFQAAGYIRAMRDAAAAGADEVQAVVVIRHSAIPMAFNDAMWAKYGFGKDRKVKDYPSGKWAMRNPFVGAAPSANQQGSPSSGASSPRAQPTLEWLASHGNILLGCDLATRGEAGVIAQRTKGDATAIYQELKANLVPGLILQPTGVYAVHRAQEAGCTYIRST